MQFVKLITIYFSDKYPYFYIVALVIDSISE